MTAETGNGGGAASGDGAGSAEMGAGTIRVISCHADAASGDQIRDLLDTLAGVRVVDEIAEVKNLLSSIGKYFAHLVLANLDQTTEEVLSAVGAAEKSCPETAFFAISSKNDANLILTAMRSGFSEFVRLPEESARLCEAIGTLRRRSAEEGATGQIITVIASAGGVGCTKLAVNLAVELAEEYGQEVAQVDLDFQFGHVAMLLDLEIQHSIADLCGAG